MKCEQHPTDLSDLSKTEIIRVLKQERNDFAKSRQQWIQAAFNLMYSRGYDTSLFVSLVEEELCDKCVKQYTPKR
jgi:hypothetical protein